MPDQKTLALKINEINKASLQRSEALREQQKQSALKELIASQKSSRGPSLAGRVSGLAQLGHGPGTGGTWSKASSLKSYSK